MESIEEVKEDLRQYEGILKDIHFTAWNEYKDNYSSFKHFYRRRTRAAVLNDHIIEQAKIQFGEMGGVEWIENNRIWLLNIEGKYTIRFKMLDNYKKAKNIKTKNTNDFYMQLDIPWLPKTTKLIVGYILNYMETSIKDICVVCPNGGINAWHYSLIETSQIELFENITSDDIYDKPDQVRIKEFQEKRKKDGTKN